MRRHIAPNRALDRSNAIRAHAGDIRIRNMPGTGSVFVIELPLAGEGKSMAQPVR